MDSNALRQPATVVFNTDYNVINYLTFRLRGVLITNDFFAV
jgi:hypothetical protein